MKCVDCDAEITGKSPRCKKCRLEHKRKVAREYYRNRYHSDPEFRKRVLSSIRKTQKKRKKWLEEDTKEYMKEYLRERKWSDNIIRLYGKDVLDYIIEQDFTCMKCHEKFPPGFGKERVSIHHIDNNSKNNKRENIAFLCRNCHNGFHSDFKKFLKEKHPELMREFYHLWIN